MRRVLAWSLAHPRLAVAATVVVALAFAPGLLRLESDNSARTFFPRSAEERSTYERFVATFGGDSAVRVVWRSKVAAEPADFEAWREVERALAGVEGVRAVVGPATWAEATGREWPPSGARRDLDRSLGWVFPAEPPGEGLSALVFLEDGDSARERRTLKAVEAAAARAGGGLAFEIVGFPVLAGAFDDSAREVFRRSFPLLVLAASALLFWVFRDLGGVLVPLGFVAWCEVVVLGAMGWTGERLNLISGVLPPLLFVIALATAVHLVTRERELRRAGAGVPVGEAYREKGKAVLWTAASAASGFGALATSDVGPVRSVGLWAAIGCAVIVLATFTLLPALLILAERSRRPGAGVVEATLHRLGCGVAEASLRRFRRVLAVTIAVAVVAVAGTTRLETESNALRYLRPAHPVRAGMERLESAGVGVAAVEVFLRGAPGWFAGGEGVNRLSWLALRFREETTALGVAGAGDFVDDAMRSDDVGARAIGGSAPRAAALAAMKETESGRAVLRGLVSEDGRAARITLFSRMASLEDLEALRVQAAAIVAEECPDCTVEFTGQYPLLLATQGQLLMTLGRSFALAAVGIAFLLWLLLRRVRLTLLAMVPNILPSLVVLGAMGWLKMPIDIATVMVASTTLGLALDDTIHTLVPFREQVRSRPTHEAVLATVEKNATAYSVSGLVLGMGFLACAISEFAPIQRFGILSFLSIALAILADFLLVPALLGGAPRSVLVKKGS